MNREISNEYAPVLSKEEEIELGKRIKDGDKEAINELVIHNLRLVLYYAKNLLDKGLSLEDLRQAGCEGLIIAAMKFDYTKGYTFNTYAQWWINRFMYNAIIEGNNNMLTTSRYIYSNRQKAYKAWQKLKGIYGEDVSYEDIAKEANMSVLAVKAALECPYTTSLESLFDNTTDVENGNIIGNVIDKLIFQNQDYSLDELVENKCFEEDINRALKTLSKKEEMIIRMYYGIVDEENPNPRHVCSHTFEECGKYLNATRQYAESTLKRGLAKLRCGSKSRILKSYYEDGF